jgi:hypothetical protein
MGRTDEYVWQRGEEESVSEGVLEAVTAVSDCSSLELPPLQESVDVDSLNRLFVPPRRVQTVQFEYAGYEVTVEPECIRVSERS